MRLAHLLLVALAVGAGVVTFTAWSGAGATARAELMDRGQGLVWILVTALEESRERARDSIAREQQRLLSVARRARLELSLPLGPARERLEAIVREEGVGRAYLFDREGVSRAVTSSDLIVIDDGDAPSPVVLEDGVIEVEAIGRRLVALLPEGTTEAVEGPTLNAFAATHRIAVGVRLKDGGALLLSSRADHLEEGQRGLGAMRALQDICRLPDVRAARLSKAGGIVAEAGAHARPEDPTFRATLPDGTAEPLSVELRLSTERVDALAASERARILLWGGLAAGIASLTALLLWRRERTQARQRAREEAAAREQQRLAEMGVLTGLFVHEVSNPLNALGLQLEGVKRAAGGAGAEEIARVKATLARVRSALESFLHVAMPMEGRAGEVYGAERLRRTVAELRAESPAADLVLEVLPQAEALAVPARVPVLDQALRNLLRNALEAAPPGSLVRARWAGGSQDAVEGGVEILVRDLGLGFPAGVLASGGALGAAGRREGHGLGLYLARRIVEGLGGRMTLSNPEDGGAEVRVRLPGVSVGDGSRA